MTRPSGILEEMTIDEVRELAPNVAVIPLGSTEPHGPALPYGTDMFQVNALARMTTRLANEQGGRVICYPTLPITLNNNFRRWPFACRLRVRTFMAMLTDIIEQAWADGIRRVLILNGHGGNPEAIGAVMRDLAARDDVPFVCMTTGAMADEKVLKLFSDSSPHGGEREASLQLHLKPDLVRKDKLADNPVRQPTIEALRSGKVAFVRPWHLFVPVSAGGDQRPASAEKGQAVLESASRNIAAFLVELSQAPPSEDFPY